MPVGVSEVTAARSKSTADKCLPLYCAASLSHCVSLPQPGPPSTRMTAPFGTMTSSAGAEDAAASEDEPPGSEKFVDVTQPGGSGTWPSSSTNDGAAFFAASVLLAVDGNVVAG